MTPGRAILIAASGTAIALSLRSALGRPVPLWLAAVALVAYLGVLLLGALTPRLGMFARVFWRGPSEEAEVALTFDDGPHAEHTRAMLRALDEFGAPATFFVLGEKAARHPEIVTETVARGHLVGIHGYHHDRLLGFRSASQVRHDLERAISALEAITGSRPTLYRPAVGQTNPTIARVARELGLHIVGWSIRSGDGIRRSTSSVLRRVVNRLDRGAVVLLHDSAERGDRIPASLAAIGPIMEALRERGLRPVRLDSWLNSRERD